MGGWEAPAAFPGAEPGLKRRIAIRVPGSGLGFQVPSALHPV